MKRMFFLQLTWAMMFFVDFFEDLVYKHILHEYNNSIKESLLAPRKKPRGHGFGTSPVFLAAISTILGAILFLRFGYAVAHAGPLGALLIILI